MVLFFLFSNYFRLTMIELVFLSAWTHFNFDFSTIALVGFACPLITYTSEYKVEKKLG